MRRAQYPNSRYLGDTRHMLVHDLDGENALCSINALIEAATVQTFESDTLSEALEKGFEPCESCTGV